MSKILRAIKKHYRSDYKTITRKFRATPLILRQVILYALPYIKLDIGEDSVFEIFGGEKLQGGFDMHFTSPESFMDMSYRPDRVSLEYHIDVSAENNICRSINRSLKGEYNVKFALKDGKLEREVNGNIVSIDL